jgi:hypothetical protein
VVEGTFPEDVHAKLDLWRARRVEKGKEKGEEKEEGHDTGLA